MIPKGLLMSSFKKLQKTLGVTSAEFVRITRISLRTLQRRQKSGKFLPDESERIFRLSCAVDQALHVMRDEEAARSWMRYSEARLFRLVATSG